MGKYQRYLSSGALSGADYCLAQDKAGVCRHTSHGFPEPHSISGDNTRGRYEEPEHECWR
jgi:hypothetical protein